MQVDRLKKVQGKKKRDTEAAEVKRKAIEAQNIPEQQPFTEVAEGGGDLLSSKDEDVIF